MALIVAAAENGVIGRGGGLPWRLPEDLKFFRRVTMGHPIIMGRKTHESIGRALPGRTNIVVTSDRSYEAPGCRVVHDVSEALEVARGVEGGDQVHVIGGASIYAAALPLADRIYLTRVRAQVAGDVRLPPLGDDFEEVERTSHPADDRHEYPFDFVVLQRR